MANQTQSLKDRLNGNFGVVVTTGMIIFIIAVVSFGFVLIDRVDAMTEIKTDNKIKDLRLELKEQYANIDRRLAVIESKLTRED